MCESSMALSTVVKPFCWFAVHETGRVISIIILKFLVFLVFVMQLSTIFCVYSIVGAAWYIVTCRPSLFLCRNFSRDWVLNLLKPCSISLFLVNASSSVSVVFSGKIACCLLEHVYMASYCGFRPNVETEPFLSFLFYFRVMFSQQNRHNAIDFQDENDV